MESNVLLANVADRFYLQGQSKTEIARDLNLSRFKVARLLQNAREEGIVEIKIAWPSRTHAELETRVAKHLHLDKVLIVPADDRIETERDSLGKAAAAYVEQITTEGQTLGLAWGRTLLHVASHLDSLPPVTLVQLTGVIGSDITQSPIEVATRIRETSKVETKALLAPLFASTDAAAAALRDEPAVREVMAYYTQLDTALLSVGSWQPRVTQLTGLDPKIQSELDSKGARADFCGLFFDDSGKFVTSRLDALRISVSPDELAMTPTVIAVAGSDLKTKALHSVAMTGLITCLVTTDTVAESLLKLEPVLDPLWNRRPRGSQP